MDYAHGILPESDGKDKSTNIVLSCLRDLFDKFDFIKAEGSLPENERWHSISRMNRVFRSIRIAINDEHHRSAYREGKTTINRRDLLNLSNMAATSTRMIIDKSRNVVNDVDNKKEINWHEVAISYEAARIIRAKGKIANALDIAIKIKSCKLKKEQTNPGKIRGLVSFNKILWAKMSDFIFNAQDDEFIKNERKELQYYVMSASIAVTRNSKHGAALGVSSQEPEYTFDALYYPMLYAITFFGDKNKEGELHCSSIINFESTVRVFFYQLWANTNRSALLPLVHKFYSDLPKVVENTSEFSNVNSKWLKSIMIAKFNQNAGSLFSEVSSSYILDEEFTLSEWNGGEKADQESKNMQEITAREKELASGLKKLSGASLMDSWDSPSHIRKEHRRRIINDMKTRAKSMDIEGVSVNRLSRLLGDPCKPNPLTANGLAEFLSKNKSSNGRNISRHLRHFPQGKINQAQVAISMAYMQLIMRDGLGVFSQLDQLVDIVEDKNKDVRWKVGKKLGYLPRLQFTIGYFAKGSEDGKSRKNLTRVNRFDELMLIANAISLVSDVIDSELRATTVTPERFFEDNLRLCSHDELLTSNLSDEKLPYIHEIFYYCKEICQSPIRVKKSGELKLSQKDESLDKAFDSIIRVAFARIYSLTISVEHLARMLSDKPLREPYFSSCVLLVEQARLLLEFITNDWLNSNQVYESVSNHYEENFGEELNQIKNPKKSNYFHNIKSLDIVDNSDEVRTELATEYNLSYILSRDLMESCLKKNLVGKLTFNKIENWQRIIKQSINLRYESSGSTKGVEYSEGLEQEKFEKIATKYDSEYSIPPQNELLATDAYSEIFKKSKNKKEWILWSRLVWYPTAFVGRVLVNTNTPRDLNQDSTEPVSQLFREQKDAYCDYNI